MMAGIRPFAALLVSSGPDTTKGVEKESSLRTINLQKPFFLLRALRDVDIVSSILDPDFF